MERDTAQLIEKTAAHSARFYIDRWGTLRDHSDLPTITREDFLDTPLSKRRYKEERSLIKIVHDGKRAFLSEWSFDDIAKEEWGTIGKRPLVYMTDAHEALEKSMWCYEKGVVPLIGEPDPDIAAFAASKYKIDSLVTDARALVRLETFLRAHVLEHIAIVGESFDVSTLQPFAEFASQIELVLARPETGALARARFAEKLTFTPVSNCHIRRDGESLIVTKTALLITPIIRYRFESPHASQVVC